MRTISLRRRILVIALGLTVLSQCAYLVVNVQSFRTSYHEVIQSNLTAIGNSLKENLDRILHMGISIHKLVGLESLLKEVLKDSDELGAITIRDLSGMQIYACNRDRFMSGPDLRESTGDGDHPLSDDPPSQVFPLTGPEGVVMGRLCLHLDAGLMQKRIWEIALDSGTVILISVLAVIDFVFFLIAFTITLPVERAIRDIASARRQGSMNLPISRTGIDFMDRLLIRFDRFRSRTARTWIRLTTLVRAAVPEGRREQVEGRVSAQRFPDLSLSLDRLRAVGAPGATSALLKSPVLIRPAVFIFIFSEALSISFLPLFAKALYRPFWGLSQEVVIGLPISAFMLFVAMALPIGGAWSDRIGHRKAFLIGSLISAVGLVLTGMAQNMVMLILFRSLVGFGFGVVFMSSQNYVIETTTTANRAEGLAMFISAFYAGTLCGSAIGGMLADRVGFRAIFLLGAALALASIFFLYRFLPDLHSPAIGKSDVTRGAGWSRKLRSVLPSPRDFRRLFADRDFAALVLLQNIPNKICLIGFVYYIAPLFLQDLGNSRSETGRYIMGYSLAMILFSQAFSRWSDRRQKMKAGIVWGGILSGLVLVPFFMAGNTLMVALGILFLGLAHAVSVSNQTKMASQFPVVRRVGLGSGLGIYRLSERAGNVIAPILAGFLVSTLGYATSLAILGVYTLGSSLLYLAVSRKRAYLRVRLEGREPIPCTVNGKPVRLLDLGLGGLSFSGIALEPGDAATVELRLPERTRPVSVDVEVIRMDQEGISHCRFESLSVDVGEAIQAHVFSRAESGVE